MIPIELPITMGAPEAPAFGLKHCGGEGAGSQENLGPGLLTVLKESFAAIMAEISAQPSARSNESQLPNLPPDVSTEVPSDLPEALAALVAFFSAGQDQAPICENLLLKPMADAMDEDAIASSAGQESCTADTSELSVINLAELKNKDQALERWMALMGVTDGKIKERALERWLRLQQTPAASQAKAVRRFALPLPGLQANMEGFPKTVGGFSTMIAKMAFDMTNDGTKLTGPESLPSEAAPGNSLNSDAQPAGILQALSNIMTPTPAPEGSASAATLAPVPEDGSPVAALKDRTAPMMSVPTAMQLGSEGETQPAQAPDSPGGQQAGADKDGSLSQTAKRAKGATVASASPPLVPEAVSEDKQGLFPQPVLEKEKPMPLHHSLSNQAYVTVDKESGGNGVITEAPPNQEQIALGKPLASGGGSKVDIQNTAAQSFLRQQAPDVLTQIVDKAVVTIKNDQKEMKLELKPEFLGQMRMRIVTENQQVSIRILTESAAVKNAIESHLHQLKADLGSHGLQVDKVDVFVSADSYHQPDQRDTPNFHGGGRLSKEERQARERNEHQKQDARRERSPSANTAGIDYFV